VVKVEAGAKTTDRDIACRLLAIAVLGFYVFKISGPWRWIFIITATAALWLDAFVGIIQAFAKLPPLHELAPKGSEPPFPFAALRDGRLVDRLVPVERLIAAPTP